MDEDSSPILHFESQAETFTEVESLDPEFENSEDGPSPCLVVMSGPDVGRIIALKPGETTVGRRSSCDVTLVDSQVSREHARIVGDGETFRIEDLDSKNGTSIDGELIEDEAPLSDGAKVAFGTETIAEFTLQDEVDESFYRDLYDSSVRDDLTGAYSKAFVGKQLRRLSGVLGSVDVPIYIAMLDIDQFKHINDKHGHLAGDEALSQLADTVRSALGGRDVLCGRYGGDEFALIFRESDESKVEKFVEGIRKSVEEATFAFARQEFEVTVSIGVASTAVTSSSDLKEVLYAADRALYEAKRDGGNACRVRRSDSSDAETLHPF